MTMNMRVTAMAVLVAAVATVAVPVIVSDGANQVPYLARISIIDYERTSYTDYDLIVADVTFAGAGWGMPPNGMWSIWDINGSQVEEASYKTVIEMINSAELGDLKSYICPKDGRLGISNEAIGTVKMCFVVPADFEPDVVSFRAGVGWQIAPLRDPSLACESYREFCHKSGAYVISEKQPEPEPEPDMIDTPTVVYNAQDGVLVVLWSDPVTLFSAANMLFTDRGAVEISLDDYTYDVVDTVMWFKFGDSVTAQIGEGNTLAMLVTDDTVRGHNGTKISKSIVEAIIIN